MPQLPQALTRRAWLPGAALALSGALALTVATASWAATVPTLDFLFMSPPDQGNHELMAPLGLAYDAPSERLYVADTSHNRIVIYNKNGGLITSFKHWVRGNDGNRTLGEPWRLLSGDHGTLLVADRQSDHIDIVDLFGATVDTIDVTVALGNGERADPGAMARDAAGNLYVVEHNSGRVVVLDKRQRVLRTFGPKYDADMRFKSIAGLAVASDGTTYVLDSVEGNVIQAFDPTGKPLGGFGKHGDKISDFHLPVAVALDQANRLWIVDAFSHDLKVFSTDGQYLAQFGQMGLGRGEFYYPSGVVLTPDNVLYVLEKGGARYQAFRVSGS